MNTGKKVLTGLIAGLATGSILGVLFAPGKGSSTRKKISKKSDDYLNGISNTFDDYIGGISKKFESIKDEAINKTDNGKEKVEGMQGILTSSAGSTRP